MKVILTKDVKGLGRAHDSVVTSDGYALNFLIPKKMAVPATAAALKEAETHQKQVQDRATLDTALLTQAIAALAEARVVIKMKVNDKGHLYDAVDAADVVAAVKSSTNLDLPAEVIKLEKPIKEIGTFTVPVAFGEVFGSFPLTVEAEA